MLSMPMFARLRSWWGARRPKSADQMLSVDCRPQESDAIRWLDPWSSTENNTAEYRSTFVQQLGREIRRGHQLYGLPVDLIGRGNGDDCLFEIQDGTGRVAVVHLVW